MTPVVFAILLASANANAAQPATAAAPPAASTQAPSTSEKPVCRREEQVGSRVLVKRCMTQAEWDQQDEQVRQYFQDAHDHGGLTNGPGNPMAGH